MYFMDVKISVIVPVYNVSNYLESCIHGILKQTLREFELILVNDGSNDSSLEICYKYASTDERIKVINKNNGGASSARNSGLEASKGDYIVFVDGDDFVSEYYLEHLYYSAIDGNYDIVQCKFASFSELSSISKNALKNKNGRLKAVSKEEALNLRVFSVVSWGAIYKRLLFENNRYYEGIINEDDDIYYRLVYSSKKIGILDEVLYFYRIRNNSVSDFQKKNFSRDFIDIYQRRIAYFAERNEYTLEKGSIFRYALVLALAYSKNRKNKANHNLKGELLSLFKDNFKKIDFKQKYKASDVLFLKTFNLLPNFTALLVNIFKKY